MTSDDMNLCKNVVLYLNLASKIKDPEVEKRCFEEASSCMRKAAENKEINFSQVLKLETVLLELGKPKDKTKQENHQKKMELLANGTKDFITLSKPEKMISYALKQGKEPKAYLENYDKKGLPLDNFRKYIIRERSSLTKRLYPANVKTDYKADFLQARKDLLNAAEERYIQYQRQCIETIAMQKPDLFITKAYIGYNPDKHKEIRLKQNEFAERKEAQKNQRKQESTMEL